MGNAAASERRFVKRDESFGSKSPLRTARIRQENGAQQQHSHRQQQNGSGGGTPPVKSPLLPPQNGTFGSGEPLPPPPPPPAERNGHLRQHRFSQLSQRSHSLEQSVNGTHSPSSSRSSSSNTSYLSSMLLNGGGAGDRNAAAAASSCLRQSVEPLFAISGDLTPHQIGLVKRTWKQALKAAGNDETELACRLLLRVFQMDPRTLVYFSLKDVPLNEFAIRSSPIFMSHVKAFEPTLVHVMNHLTNATTLSKHLQQLGGRHVNYTGVTYKCSYWKCFTQSLIDVLFPDNKGGSSSDELHDALAVLGDFCVEQMRIGYRIEYKLQCEAERYQAQVQQRRRRRDLSMQRDMQAHHHVHAHHPPRRN